MMFMDVRGHLATITSEAENTFITTQLGDTAGAWLGGEQLPDSEEPAGGWQWSTGDPWVYTNWDSGEPNNTYFGGWGKEATEQSEERLHYHHDGTHWNDLPNDPEVVTPRFIVEWDIPINNDCIEPPAGLTGWWPGDGNTDDIVGGRNAVLKNGATFVSSLIDKGFRLDGIDDFIEVPHAPALNVGTGDFTVDLWVNFNTTDGEQVLVEKYVEDFSETPPGWVLTKLEGNSLRFGTGPALPDHGVDSPPLILLPNTWIHFAARRSDGIASIFVNGEEVATGPFVDNADSDSSLKFGHRGNPEDTPGSTDDSGFFLNGRIDEVEVFVDRALSDTEIQAIFNAGSAGKCKDTEVVEITIDIKPGSSRNHINPKSKGVIPVAILTTEILDATTVDPLSVRFGPGSAKEVHQKQHIKDVNRDGEPDLVLHFKTRATGIRCGDTSASLTGETFDGNSIHGSDFIKTVGCKK
jgi:hypothetical protein